MDELRILKCLADSRQGGPQQEAFLNAKWLRDDHNINTEFLFPDGPGEFISELKKERFVVHQPGFSKIYPPRHILKNISYALHSPIGVYKILNIISKRNYDLIHIKGAENLLPILSGWLSDCPVIWHFPGSSIPSVLKLIVKTIAPRIADELIFSSTTASGVIFDEKSHGQIVFPPVSLNFFNTEQTKGTNIIRTRFHLSEDIPIIGTVGNINPAKDHKTLFRAVREVIDEWGEIVVPVVGRVSKTKTKYFQQIKELRDDLDLEENVLFLGWQSDIREILSSFDLFVLSSKRETGPMALMEAMALGVPAVTTRVGVVRDVESVEDICWVAPPNSVAELARNIQFALEEKNQWQEIGSNARTIANNYFSVDRIASSYAEIYRSTF